MLIGVISDTHGLLRPEVKPAFRGVDLILHAGDVGAPQILDELGAMAGVVAVRGNVDVEAWCRALPPRKVIRAAAVTILMLHDVHELDRSGVPPGAAVVISGHSHRPSIEHRGGVLFLNPGSAGPRRFTLPVSVALLKVEGSNVNAEIVQLLPRDT